MRRRFVKAVPSLIETSFTLRPRSHSRSLQHFAPYQGHTRVVRMAEVAQPVDPSTSPAAEVAEAADSKQDAAAAVVDDKAADAPTLTFCLTWGKQKTGKCLEAGRQVPLVSLCSSFFMPWCSCCCICCRCPRRVKLHVTILLGGAIQQTFIDNCACCAPCCETDALLNKLSCVLASRHYSGHNHTPMPSFPAHSKAAARPTPRWG